MRCGVLVGSIAVHAVLAALLYAVHRRAPAAPPPRPPIDIEVIEVAPPPAAAPAVPEAGGGSPGGAMRPAPAPASAPPTPAAPTPPPAPTPPARSAAPAAPPLAITGYDRGGTLARAPGDGGTGTGSGGGTGDGFGRGAGPGAASLASLASLPPPPAPPPPPPVEALPSKARPPRLVYPARDREGEEAEMFIARLTVDTDGYVVGARLVRGRGNGPRDDDVATSAVWRFRYAPALDDAGRAIRATIDQRFLVDR